MKPITKMTSILLKNLGYTSKIYIKFLLSKKSIIKLAVLFTVAFNALIACALEKPIPWIISTASSFGAKEFEDTLDDVDDDDGGSKSSAKSFKKMQ